MIHHAADLPLVALLCAMWWHGALVGGAVVALVMVGRRWVEP